MFWQRVEYRSLAVFEIMRASASLSLAICKRSWIVVIPAFIILESRLSINDMPTLEPGVDVLLFSVSAQEIILLLTMLQRLSFQLV